MSVMGRLPFRLRASLVHLVCSAAIAAAATMLIFVIWHPGAVARLQGISRIVIVMFVVNIVLGPVLTLLLFSPRKARHLLKLDLSIVVALQLIALVYGLVTIFNARPVYVVFNVDRFTVVAAAEIVQESLRRTKDPEFRCLPLGRPRIIAARLPDDPVARTDLMFSSLDGGPDIFQFPELFVEYSQERLQAASRSHPLAELQMRNDMSDAEWQAFVFSLKRPAGELAYLPVEGNAREGVAIIDRQSGEVVKLVDLYPEWG